MSRRERRYQRYLERKWQKSGGRTTPPGGGGATASQVAAAAQSAIHEALVPANLFELGIGNLFLSRALPDGRLAAGGFLLDIFCLGVKDAFAAFITRDKYAERLSRMSATESFEPIEPACFRKLVEGAVAYARDLGFSPHADYAAASQIFGDLDSTACSRRFEYGRDGKPCYVSGPHETPAQVRAILEQLERRLGSGNFHYLVSAE